MSTRQTKILTTAIILSVATLSFSSAQEKGMPGCPMGDMPSQPGMKMRQMPPQMQTMQTPIRAEDWVNAWQMAKEVCSNADTLTIQLADRSGPSFQGIKVFECVELKASGELLIIKVKKTDKQAEAVMIIRASDMIRLEIMKMNKTS